MAKNNYEYRLVTPEEAIDLFKNHNTKNRNFRINVAQKYARDMLAGNWQNNGETISIDTNGNIKNGQHRLYAVYLTSKPQMLGFVTGVEPDVYVFDSQTKRSVSDNLRIAGLKPELANRYMTACVNNLVHVAFGGNSIYPTSVDIRRFIDKYSAECEQTVTICKYCSGKNGYKFTHNAAFMSAVLYALLGGVNYNVLNNFATTVRTGLYNDNTETAAISLRNSIIDGSLNGQGRMETIYRDRAIEKAINDYVNGKPRMKRYTMNEVGPYSSYLSKLIKEEFRK